MVIKKDILIVEDNEINRGILAEILSEDYRVLEAENGQVALDVLKEHKKRISLILLDVQMPVMDGYTFLNQMKEDEELSLIPVIVMTQGTSEEDELEALAHGATDFLPKPYRPQIILHRVAGLIKLRENAAMVNQLEYDRLTGLYSKEFFFRKVQEQLLEDPQGNYCIVGSNIENFKLVNDIFGTRQGDVLLKEVADLTRKIVGSNGFCGRFGSDRFVCFLSQEKERMDRENYISFPDQDASDLLKSTVMRWGIYDITDRTIPVEQMCDRALLAADSIKNQYHQYFAVYDDSLRSKLLREQAITSVMEQALDEGQFVVYLQPKYSLKDDCMAGAEALVRWFHPEWGFMSPGEFIPLFEKNGFIPRLDQFVWEQVCRQLGEWKEKGYPLLPISVNISRADVFQENLSDIILALTEKYGIDPAYLHLEITESAYVEKPDQIIKTAEDLRKLGFNVELDDFGSGYSSFNMLSQMSLDILKLDMKFIQNELARPADRSFLKDIINMAHRADLAVVAEGVETREQMNRLHAAGCDYVQGYFFAKPMPIQEYEKLLLQQDKYSNPAGQRSTIHQKCLLVVDQDAEYRSMVRKTFDANYHVIEADSAEDALVCIKTSENDSISAVILSMALPGKGTSLVMDFLRQTPCFWNIPILATIPSSKCTSQMPLAREADDFLCKCHPLFDLQSRVQKMIEAAYFRKKERILQDEANRDPLTGLLNRRGFQNSMDGIGSADLPIAMCIFDLDNLKKVNDTYGHEMGDRMLQSFADLIYRKTRLGDIRCRYGGDEFIVVLKNIEDEKTALKKGESICRAFQECGKEEVFSTSCSVGIALCNVYDDLTSDLIMRADQALYRAKRENKGGCCMW